MWANILPLVEFNIYSAMFFTILLFLLIAIWLITSQ